MNDSIGRARYRYIGRAYDAVSMEQWLYRSSRQRLHEMIGPLPGATVVDAGCGTGLNFEGLQHVVGPNGRVIGVDASASMLAAARRRIRRSRWTNVSIIHSDIADLMPSLRCAGIPRTGPDAIIATFVVATLPDDSTFWRFIDELRTSVSPLVALADLGEPESACWLAATAMRAFAALGGNRRSSQPWLDLAKRSDDLVTEAHRGGHVRLACGHCRPAILDGPSSSM